MNVLDRRLVHVVAIVPLAAEFGSDELLVFPDGEVLLLPSGPLQPGERLLGAAGRIVLEQAGFLPEGARLVYLLEAHDGTLIAGVQCNLPADLDDDVDLRGEFMSLSRTDMRLEPMALREILVEDLRSGFVRPVAHLIELTGGGGPPVQITW
jgi:hypothetical protein